MKIKLMLAAILLTITIPTACGESAPLTPPEPATSTQTPPAPTQTAAATDTALPAETSAEPQASPTAEAESQAVSFSNHILPILETYCQKCHGLERVKEGLDMMTYEDLMAGSFNGSVVMPGSANESLLVELIAKNEMPDRGPKVTQQELQTIIDWVNQGALNN